MIKFEKKLFSNEDIDGFIELSKSEFLRTKGMKNSKFIEWKFILNPLGKSNYFYFKFKDNLAGRIMSAQYPGKLAIDKKILKSFCLSDLFIKKNYRQSSNLKTLYTKCLDETNGVVFHSSNENSEKFYTKILNKKKFFDLISCGLPLSLKPLKKYNLFVKSIYYIFINIYLLHLFILKKIVQLFSKCKIEHNKNIFFDDDVKKLIDLTFYNGECFFYKDSKFFDWRYKPYENVHFLKMYKSQKLIGYIILVETEVLELKNMIIIDFLFLKNLSLLDRFKIKNKIIEISKRNSCDTIYSLGNKNNYMFQNIIGYPFFNLPDTLLPHSNPMFIHNLPDKNYAQVANINFTISDFDYF